MIAHQRWAVWFNTLLLQPCSYFPNALWNHHWQFLHGYLASNSYVGLLFAILEFGLGDHAASSFC